MCIPSVSHSIEVAQTKDEIEACYDIRMEGERAVVKQVGPESVVFVVEQVRQHLRLALRVAGILRRS